MLASKPPYPTPSLGGSGSSQYPASVATYRVQAASRSDHAFFASPTESEFSEAYDTPDSVRYGGPGTYISRDADYAGIGMKKRWPTGCNALTARSTLICSKVSSRVFHLSI
jgi:hypothetical protein